MWSGWQGEIPRVGQNLLASLLIAVNADGSPIVAQSRDEFVDRGTATWTGTLSYPAASTDRGQATLTVRQRERDPHAGDRVALPRRAHDRGRAPRAPFDCGAIFEFIYPARDPIPAGSASRRPAT